MAVEKPLLILLQILAAQQLMNRAAPEWDYSDTNMWIRNYPTCNGPHQSPINLNSLYAISRPLPPIIFKNYERLFAYRLVMANNGHTVKIVLPETVRGPRPTISGSLFNGEYEAQSLHFHWGSVGFPGSEHSVNGRHFDVELHIVHKNMKYGSVEEAKQFRDGLAVITVMMNIANNPFTFYPGLNKVFKNLPRIVNAGTKTTIDHQLSLRHFLGDVDTKNFYAYEGSLTTPSCSESVIWHIFPQPLYISREMIKKFFLLKQENGAPLVNNYRPLQPSNQRPIYLRFSH